MDIIEAFWQRFCLLLVQSFNQITNMKSKVITSILCIFILSGAAMAAKPYSTKKAPKLLKAQSPTIIVQDLPSKNLLQTEKEPESIFTKKAQPKVETSAKELKPTPKSTSQTALSSSVYVPTAKKLRQIVKQQKKQAKQQAKQDIGSSKSLLAAILFCVFLGIIGAHRFYLGYYGIGIIHVLTLGFFGIWTLIDLILLLTGGLHPKNGKFEKDLEEELDTVF